MKTEALKRIIKEAVREAIQEELKEVLLEAVKSPKAVVTQPIQESITSTTPSPVTQTPKKSLQTHPCLLYTSPSPRDRQKSRMPSSA